MAHHIILQPDGLFALWSTIVDDFLMVDATAEEIIQQELEGVLEDRRERLNHILGELKEKGKYQFMLTWDEAQATRKAVHEND